MSKLLLEPLEEDEDGSKVNSHPCSHATEVMLKVLGVTINKKQGGNIRNTIGQQYQPLLLHILINQRLGLETLLPTKNK